MSMIVEKKTNCLYSKMMIWYGERSEMYRKATVIEENQRNAGLVEQIQM